MEFVGIRNVPEKARLLRDGSWTVKTYPVRDLAFDCFRHIEFLKAVQAGLPESEYPETLYWKFLRFTGRDEQAALARCRRFVRFYKEALRDGLEDSQGLVSVTPEGIRLDGSHRVAIAYIIGRDTLGTRVFNWFELFSPKQVRGILQEAEVKREVQKRYLYREVVDRENGQKLGRIVLVSAHTISKPAWFPWGRKRVVPLVLVETADGTLYPVELESVEVVSKASVLP